VPDYEQFARFYDSAMDDPTPRGARVLGVIERYCPDVTSILELGCGTGSILDQLSSLPTSPSLTGMDRSPEMLAVASSKVPEARLFLGDMAAFQLGERFDVVVCVFDTINHLPTFEAWQSMFDAVHEHLVDGGLFVFDVNTIGELRRLAQEPPWVYDFDDNVLIMDVALAEDGLSDWDIRIFEHVRGDRFTLHHERIAELGVSLRRIRSALLPLFDPVEETSEGGETPTDSSVKAYFTYRRRPGPP
jgi:predicted TPR repeat methyltransferase